MWLHIDGNSAKSTKSYHRSAGSERNSSGSHTVNWPEELTGSDLIWLSELRSTERKSNEIDRKWTKIIQVWLEIKRWWSENDWKRPKPSFWRIDFFYENQTKENCRLLALSPSRSRACVQMSTSPKEILGIR